MERFHIFLVYSNLGPHAGYRYCGACAAHAYSQIDPTHVKRVFILGPSHHYRLNGCAVSDCTKYATPLYDLTVIFFIVNFSCRFLNLNDFFLFEFQLF